MTSCPKAHRRCWWILRFDVVKQEDVHGRAKTRRLGVVRGTLCASGVLTLNMENNERTSNLDSIGIPLNMRVVLWSVTPVRLVYTFVETYQIVVWQGYSIVQYL